MFVKKLTFILALCLPGTMALAGGGVLTSEYGPAGDISVFVAQSSATAGTGQILVASGSAVALGVYFASTTANNSYVTFRDTTSVNGTGAIKFRVFNSTAVGFPGAFVPIKPPVQFYAGLTAETNTCPTFVGQGGDPANAWCYTVVYTKLP